MSERQPIRFIDVVVAGAVIVLSVVLLFAAVGCHAVPTNLNHTATGQVLNRQQQADVQAIHDDTVEAKASTDTIAAKATDAQAHLAKVATSQPSPDLTAAQSDLADILKLAKDQGDVLTATVTRTDTLHDSLTQSSTQLTKQATQDAQKDKALAAYQNGEHRAWLGMELVGGLLVAVGLAVCFEVTKTLGSFLIIVGAGLAGFGLFMDRLSGLNPWWIVGMVVAAGVVFVLTRLHLKIWNNTPDVVPAKPATGA